MSRYCVSDLHGNMNIYKKMCADLGPEDIVYFLGDANDRGEENYQLILEIMNNPQWEYLRGNHEQMLIDAANDVLKLGRPIPFMEHSRLLDWNGGYDAYKQLMADPNREEVFEKLDNLPHYKTVFVGDDTYILCHSGYNPSWRYGDNRPSTKYLWERDHIHMAWPQGYDDLYIVHGHTPIPNLLDRYWDKEQCIDYILKNGAYTFGGGHWIDIDAGGYWDGLYIRYDLDTKESKIYREEE